MMYGAQRWSGRPRPHGVGCGRRSSLFVDFTGPLRSRLESLGGLAVAGLGLLCPGPLCAQTTWLATVLTAVVAFTILLLGVLSCGIATCVRSAPEVAATRTRQPRR